MSGSIIVVYFIGFAINLGLEDTSVVRYAKSIMLVPKSGSQRPSGRRGPERPDVPEPD